MKRSTVYFIAAVILAVIALSGLERFGIPYFAVLALQAIAIWNTRGERE